jgi:transmembrane sensor
MSGESVAADALAEEAATWFVRLRSDAVSEAERRAFQHWLAAAEAHRSEYAQFQRLWGELDAAAPRRRRGHRAAVASAVLGLALALLAGAWQAHLDVDYRTVAGELRHLELADGTIVELDGASELHVEYRLWQRRIELPRGQALFRVAPGWRPFAVASGDAVLRDIGTTFAVLAEGSVHSVAVAEGVVDIELADGRSQRLQRGERVAYSATALGLREAVDPAEVTAWTQERWSFSRQPLGRLLAQANRQFEKPLELADPALADCRVSGVLQRGDRMALLRTLAVLLPLRVEETPQATRLGHR